MERGKDNHFHCNRCCPLVLVELALTEPSLAPLVSSGDVLYHVLELLLIERLGLILKHPVLQSFGFPTCPANGSVGHYHFPGHAGLALCCP